MAGQLSPVLTTCQDLVAQGDSRPTHTQWLQQSERAKPQHGKLHECNVTKIFRHRIIRATHTTDMHHMCNTDAVAIHACTADCERRLTTRVVKFCAGSNDVSTECKSPCKSWLHVRRVCKSHMNAATLMSDPLHVILGCAAPVPRLSWCWPCSSSNTVSTALRRYNRKQQLHWHESIEKACRLAMASSLPRACNADRILFPSHPLRVRPCDQCETNSVPT